MLFSLLALPPTLHAEDYLYTDSNGEITITKYTGPDGAVTIPGTINDLPVVGIGESAFSTCTGLTSVNIPNSITSIGGEAFYGCIGLTSVRISNGITRLGLSVFSGCLGLTSVSIPNGVTSIGDSAFFGCTGLASVSIPSGVTSIEDAAFAFCTGLTDMELPNSLTSIGIDAFGDCTGLTSMSIPDGVTSIGNSAFYHCIGLTGVGIPVSVTSIEEPAFYGCAGLTSVELPNGVTSIGESTFYGCTGLISVSIPNGVTSIGDYAFYNCIGLTGVSIPASVTSIGSYAFDSCTGLTAITVDPGNSAYCSEDGVLYDLAKSTLIQYPGGKVGSYTIPASVTSLADSGFYGCPELTAIMVASGNTTYSSMDGVLYNQNQTQLIQCPRGKKGSYTIPASVTSLGHNAFRRSSLANIGVDVRNPNYSSVDGVLFDQLQTTLIQYPGGKTGGYTVPGSVTRIGDLAFFYCTGLTHVTIPASVTTIGIYAMPGSVLGFQYYFC